MRFDVPKLADYNGAIQANQSMMNAFKGLSDQSQDYLKLEEQKKSNEWNRAFDTDKFTETKNQNAIANTNTDRAFNYGVTRDGIKDNQWGQDFGLKKDSVVFDQGYKNKVFDHNVSQDNIKNNQWGQSFANTVANQNKPDYATFNGVDAQGNPTLNMVDKNTGEVVNTGQQVYNESKKLAPEQSMYYDDRAKEMKQKNLDAVQKSLTTHPAYSTLSEEDKVKAYDYVATNGKLPEFKYSDGGWFGGEKYTIPMSEALKQEKQKELEKNMKALGL
jgi:hypothetical protein